MPANGMFKCLTFHVPEYLSSQFIKREEISRRTTRSSQMLNILLFKTASGNKGLFIIEQYLELYE